jgi:hypothetical protein
MDPSKPCIEFYRFSETIGTHKASTSDSKPQEV